MVKTTPKAKTPKSENIFSGPYLVAAAGRGHNSVTLRGPDNRFFRVHYGQLKSLETVLPYDAPDLSRIAIEDLPEDMMESAYSNDDSRERADDPEYKTEMQTTANDGEQTTTATEIRRSKRMRSHVNYNLPRIHIREQ
jgi:hypothetical protein